MAGRGPAPKDPAQRRHRNKTTTRMQLPAEGRKGKAPKFPLERPAMKDEALVDMVVDREADLWRDLWKLPQAVAWSRLKFHHEVALYCRHMILAELGDLDHAKEARMRSDRLGLTPMALRSLQWEIVEDEVGQAREAKGQTKVKPALRAVDPNSA